MVYDIGCTTLGSGSKKTHLMSICPHRNAKRARKPEITKLEVIAFVNEEILRLQITVQDAMRVAIHESHV